MIIFHKAVWKAHRYGWAGSKHLSINRFDIGHILPVGKVGETVSDDAIDLSLSFVLNTGVNGHIIEEASSHGCCLWRSASEINQSRGVRSSQYPSLLIINRRYLAVIGCELGRGPYHRKLYRQYLRLPLLLVLMYPPYFSFQGIQ